MSRVVVTGATGTIGSALCAALLSDRDQVVVLSRDPERARARLGERVEAHAWEVPTSVPPPLEALADADAVVHLLGEPIAQRWSEEVKASVRDSRVLATGQLVDALRDLPDERRPAALVSQSATGLYGPSDDRVLDEDAPAGSGFLAEVVRAWEQEARAAESLMRVVTTRTGVVLSPHGGALGKMLPFFRAGIGGPVGDGRQVISWIHLDDVVAALRFCVGQPDAHGPINLTAPAPVSNAEFSAALGRALRRPAVLPVPPFALRLLYGEMSEIVTTGQRVVPRRLLALGFRFHHPELEPALREVLGR
jgi:uncharacterized protein (TIGR01777 family)